MKINTNISAIDVAGNFNRNYVDFIKQIQKLSSGLRITGAGDDVAGLLTSERLRSQISGIQTQASNYQMDISSNQVALGGISALNAGIQRINQLAIQASNGTYNASDRQAMQDEVNQLLDNINGIAQNTTFNGNQLISNLDAAGLGIAGSDVVNNPNAVITNTQTAMETVNTEAGKFAAETNGLEHRINYLTDYGNNLIAGESRIRDADMAYETIGFNRSSLQMNANILLLAQANAFPGNVLNLLK